MSGVISWETLQLYIPIAIALILTPGADMTYCLGQGVKSGPAGGFMASMGVATGALIHIILGASGLAAIIQTHPLAFEVIRWTGVIYLVWLGLDLILRKSQLDTRGQSERSSLYEAWKTGVLINLLNPKFSLFILAFVPQFVYPQNGSTFLQFFILGMILNIGGTAVNALVGVFSGHIKLWLGKSKKAGQRLNHLTGIIFLGLAARLALSGK